MRISDWSSDVCSSDLGDARRRGVPRLDGESAVRRRRAVGDGGISWPRRLSDVQPCQGGVQTGPARRCQARRNQAALRAGNDEGRAAADEGVGYQKAEHCVQNPSVVMPDLFRHPIRSEEHTSELQALMRTSYAGFGLKKKNEY